MKRLISYFLAIFMIASVCLSCASCDMSVLNDLLEDPNTYTDETTTPADENDENDENTTDENNEETSTDENSDREPDSQVNTRPPVEPPIVEPPVHEPDYNFSDKELVILTSPDLANKTKYFMPIDQSSDYISDSAYERDKMLEDKTGVSICYIFGKTPIEATVSFEAAVMSETLEYDVFAPSSPMNLASLATNDYLLDFAYLPNINIDASYWNRELMESVAFGSYLYAGYGDIAIPDTQVVAFNKNTIENHGIYDELYEKVHSGTWTIQDLYNYSIMTYCDNNCNFDTDVGDMVGLTLSSQYVYMDFASMANFDFCCYDGNWDVSPMDGKLSEISNLVFDLSESTGILFVDHNNLVVEQLTNGYTAFAITSLSSIAELSSYSSDHGILPLPKLDADQADYTSRNLGGALFVPRAVESEEMVGAMLELLNKSSSDIKERYFTRISRSEQDVDMLCEIDNGIRTNFIDTYTDDNEIYALMQDMYRYKDSFQSYYAKIKMSFSARIQQLCK